MNLTLDPSLEAWLTLCSAVLSFVALVLAILISIDTLRHGQRVSLERSSALTVRRFQLAERTISFDCSAEIVFQGDPSDIDSIDQTYLVANVNLQNISQRPVDLLACLVAGRSVTDANWIGFGRDGREVGWEPLAHAFWNEDGQFLGDGNRFLSGLSTTANMFNSRGQTLRLEPKESDALLRLDAVSDMATLASHRQINLIYKVFVVVLGHPVTLDKRGNPVKEASDQLALLPHHHFSRWRSIQFSLTNLNRFAFRLALEAAEDTHAHDPLGRITTETGWRCFLLYHWDFEQLPDKKPAGAPDPFGDERRKRAAAGQPWLTVAEVNDYIQRAYNVYDPRQRSTEHFEEAKQYCLTELEPMVRAWRNLNDIIEWCNRPGFSFEQLIADKKSPSYARWKALLDEGYLLSNWWGGKLDQVDELAPERYVMRTKYVLATVRRPDA